MEKKRLSTSAESATEVPGGHLSLQVTSKLLPTFFQLLGQGFSVNIQTGVTVKNLLCNQLGIHQDYLAQRIQTIFLNAKVVDDINTATVDEGATLALSGAMPGLVGAILRSGGFYAPMRNQISHAESNSSPRVQSADITLKLMNLVVKELGPLFLQQGIRLKGQSLWDFLEHNLDQLEAGCISVKLDGKPLELKSLQGFDWNADMVMLRVNSQAVA